MSSLQDLQRNWENLAQADPMWAALMDPAKLGRGWDTDAFFDAGRAEIDNVLTHLEEVGVSVDPETEALDFGCGIGRLTQALAERFASALGVDISPTMIELAQTHNRHENCDYLLNEASDLEALSADRFGFIYTSVVLQHIRPVLARSYIREFSRILAPGGILVFQIPDRFEWGHSPAERAATVIQRVKRILGLRTRARRGLRVIGIVGQAKSARDGTAEMHCVSEQEVRSLFAGGLSVADVQLTNSTDLEFVGGLRYLEAPPSSGFVSKQYCVAKGS